MLPHVRSNPERAGVPPAPEPERYRLVVETTPPGAAVFVNGRPALDDNRDPVIAPGTLELAPGTYRVSVVLEGYRTEAREVTISDRDLRWRVELERTRNRR